MERERRASMDDGNCSGGGDVNVTGDEDEDEDEEGNSSASFSDSNDRSFRAFDSEIRRLSRDADRLLQSIRDEVQAGDCGGTDRQRKRHQRSQQQQQQQRTTCAREATEICGGRDSENPRSVANPSAPADEDECDDSHNNGNSVGVKNFEDDEEDDDMSDELSRLDEVTEKIRESLDGKTEVPAILLSNSFSPTKAPPLQSSSLQASTSNPLSPGGIRRSARHLLKIVDLQQMQQQLQTSPRRTSSTASTPSPHRPQQLLRRRSCDPPASMAQPFANMAHPRATTHDVDHYDASTTINTTANNAAKSVWNTRSTTTLLMVGTTVVVWVLVARLVWHAQSVGLLDEWGQWRHLLAMLPNDAYHDLATPEA